MAGVTINSPTKGQRFYRGMIKVQGVAVEGYDFATRTGVTIKDIGVRVDGSPSLKVQTGPKRPYGQEAAYDWWADVEAPDTGDVTISVKWTVATTTTDGAGNETSTSKPDGQEIPIRLTTENPALQDPADLISPRAYVKDLLDYAITHVQKPILGKPDQFEQITPADLNGSFFQPFEELADPLSLWGDQAVNQVRICSEVLRKFLGTPLSEPRYGWTAYEALLKVIGTSYAEIRLARAADEAAREALAARLGFELDPVRPDQLDKLFLEPDQSTEATLERLFGLMDTTRDPLQTVSVSELLNWQLRRLRTLWKQEDDAEGIIEPLIDPDLVSKADLGGATDSNPAFELWQARYRWIQEQLSLLEKQRKSEANPLAAFDRIVDSVLPLKDLLNLADAQKNGVNIEPKLKEMQLSLSAFNRLLRIRALTATGSVLESEWSDVYSILVQVQKVRNYQIWRQQERAKQLTLSPDYFKIAVLEPRLYATGVDAAGVALPDGAFDPHWTITTTPSGPSNAKAYVTNSSGPLVRDWMANNWTSRWISPHADQTIGDAPSSYIYRTTFDLAGLDLSNVKITAKVAVDDVLADVRLNGQSLALTASGWWGFTTLTIDGGFVAEVNSLEFMTTNHGSAANATGLRVELSFPNPPLPAQLPAWRTTWQGRQAWQDKLQARINQEQTVRQALAASIRTAEEVALPILRDALVNAIATSRGIDDAANWLTEQLLIDAKVSGSLLTTRIQQAIETLQGILFSLRTGRLEASHSAHSWKLGWSDSGGEDIEEHFDEEWQWMGSHAAWQGAMLAFLYPENLLLPTLREDQTESFKSFIKKLREKQKLTPHQAREAVRVSVQSYPIYDSDSALTLPGLFAHWRFDEGSGPWAHDEMSRDKPSGQGNQGQLVKGATWTDGRSGGALSVRGLGDHVLVLGNPDLGKVGDSGAHFSVAFWICLRGGPAGKFRTIIHKGSLDNQRTFALFLHPDSNRIHYRISTDQNWNEGSDSQGELMLNTWTHIVYTTNFVEVGGQYKQRLQLYINGNLDSEVTLSGRSISNQGNLLIGHGPMISGFDGKLDDLRIFRNRLTEKQVKMLLAISFPDNFSNIELLLRRGCLESLAKAVAEVSAEDLSILKEIAYFVPLQVALQLQKSGEYVAALDWYQAVYAVNLPITERKIYYGLEQEKNLSPDLSRPLHWLRGWLSPHKLAALRPNPYTRYTLMSLVRCFLEFADSEFARDTGESVARARSLYLAARGLLQLPELETPSATGPDAVTLPNPIVESLRQRVESQLFKLRTGRNIAGMKREIELPAATATVTGLPTIGSGGQLVIPGTRPALRPTPYRFSVLMERSKQLVNIAQQIEAAYLSVLEKRDKETYDLKQAGFHLELAEAGTELQKVRVTEASRGIQLAQRQKDRVAVQQSTYQKWIEDGINEWEDQMIKSYQQAGGAKILAAFFETGAQMAQAAISAAAGSPAAAPLVAMSILMNQGRYGAASIAIDAETSAQVASVYASFERRKQEWELQKSLADKEALIADQQELLAKDHEAVVKKEERIAVTQSTQAKATAEFLANKFTNVDLYEWMSGVLAGVYSYFLQQATAMAKLAQNQLAFERHEPPPNFIQADYWQPPAETGSVANTGDEASDRRGLTGSARLLQDIYQLDQHAFETDKRKLNLSQTFSLARLAPLEFQRFRETGVLRFVTPMELFDRAFPGHYLRLIKRVRTSVIALIPPTQGIRATLLASGISRVVIGGDIFHEVVVRRDPELVALTSPTNATGIFELDTQSEMLLPFESMGVDTSWELQLPKAANPFDFGTIADVLLTIEYTALNSFDYRQHLIQGLDRKISSDRSFSFREQFVDAWYDLNNPEAHEEQKQMVVRFETARGEFPPNVENLKIQQIALYFACKENSSFEVPIAQLHFTEKGSNQSVGGQAASTDGIISTLRGNAAGWRPMVGKTPFGEWELSFQSNDPATNKEIKDRFKNKEIEDILFVVTYSGRTPEWPA
jgi:hypothetical protein